MRDAGSVFGEQEVTVLAECRDDSLPVERVDHTAPVVDFLTIGCDDANSDELLEVPEDRLVTDAKLPLDRAGSQAAGVLGEDANDRPSNRIGSEHLYRLRRCVRQRRWGRCVARHSFIVPQTCLAVMRLPFNGRLKHENQIDQRYRQLQQFGTEITESLAVPHLGDRFVRCRNCRIYCEDAGSVCRHREPRGEAMWAGKTLYRRGR